MEMRGFSPSVSCRGSRGGAHAGYVRVGDASEDLSWFQWQHGEVEERTNSNKLLKLTSIYLVTQECGSLPPQPSVNPLPLEAACMMPSLFSKGSRKKQIASLTSAPGKPERTIILNNVASQESCMALHEDMELLEWVQRRPQKRSEGWSTSPVRKGWESWGHWARRREGSGETLQKPSSIWRGPFYKGM